MSESSQNQTVSTAIYIIIAFVGFTFLISVISKTATSLLSVPSGDQSMETEAIEKRIKPVVTLADLTSKDDMADTKMVEAPKKSAKDLYTASCSACHATGAAGAPIVGKKDQWEARVANGEDSLLASVVNGKGAMPPKGGSAFSDDELNQIVSFMLVESGFDASSDSMAAAPAAETMTTAPAAETMATAPAAETMVPATEMTKAKEVDVNSFDDGGTTYVENSSSIDLTAGETSYRGACFACHDSGVAGAPKIGDNAAWASRTGKGLETLSENASKGIGAMPPKGGAAYLSDDDMTNIVGYMLSKVQ